MKKLKHSILAGFLASLMLLCACGQGGENGSSASASQPGGYVETDITPPTESDNYHLFQKSDGALVCYDGEFKTRYESADGGDNWQEGPGPGAADERFARIWNVALLEDGSLLAELPGEEKEDGSYTPSEVVKVSPEGAVEPFTLEGFSDLAAEGKDVSVTRMQALPGGRLLFGYMYGYGSGAAAEESSNTDEATAEPGTAEESGTDAAETSLPDEYTATTRGDESTLPVSGSEETPAASEAAPEEGSEAESGEEGEDTVYYGGNYKTGLYDLATGKQLADFSEEMELAVAAGEDTLYLLGYDGALTARSLSDGSAISGVEGSAPLDDMVMSVGMALAPDGMLYIADNRALTKLDPSTGENEKLLDGSAFSFGAPSTRIDDMTVAADGTVFMNVANAQGGKLVRYSWDEAAAPDPAKALSVWMLRDSPVLRAAISEFCLQNPGASVDVEVALSEEGGMTAEDAIKALNTRMLAGEGPDLLLLDGCPAEQYAAGGMLADLAGGVDTSGMAENLKAPFETGDGTYYLPMRWQPPVLLGQGEALTQADTSEKLMQLIEAAGEGPFIDPETDDVFAGLSEEERPPLAFDSLREVFDLLWNSSAPALFPDGNVDTDTLGSFFDMLKTISDQQDLASYGEEGRPGGMMGFSTDGAGMVSVQGSPLRYISHQSRYAAYTADDPQIVFMLDEVPGTEAAFYPGLSRGAWVPACLLGVNADSDKQDFAKSFVQAALSESCQCQRVGGGLPVTGEGMDAQKLAVEELMKEFQEQNGTDYGPITVDFSALLDDAQAPVLESEVLKEMVYEAGKAYCEGTGDVNTAVSQVQQDATAYLAERQL